MNYLQRFSVALARREAPRGGAGRSEAGTGGSGIKADWLSQVKSLAEKLPPVTRRPDDTGE